MMKVRALSVANTFSSFFHIFHKSLDVKYLVDAIPTVQIPTV